MAVQYWTISEKKALGAYRLLEDVALANQRLPAFERWNQARRTS